MASFTDLALTIPLLQAPMAGVATPDLAAAISNAGALGGLGLGSSDAATAHAMIAATRARTDRPFNVNLFVHATPQADAAREAAWLAWLAPLFAEFGAEPPTSLRPAYTSFNDDPAMLAMLIEAKPPVISFHFGLPSAEALAALRATGALLMASATSLAEARILDAAGIDIVIAQGIEAGGHRGIFDPAAPDEALGSFVLTRLLARHIARPIVAAGGIMDGADIAAALRCGAAAAQMGTAFIACPESAADAAYRAALASVRTTRLTLLLSGRPARALTNRFTALADAPDCPPPPAYPIARDVSEALHAAARRKGEHGFGAHWAWQGAPRARAMPAAELVATLRREWAACAA